MIFIYDRVATESDKEADMEPRRKVLVVEDELEIQEMFARRLERFPIDLIRATTPKEAREKFEEHLDIELVMLDGCLDGDSGDVTNLIPVFRRRNIPVVAMSKSDILRMMMIDIGCTHQIEGKKFGPANVLRILGIKTKRSETEQ